MKSILKHIVACAAMGMLISASSAQNLNYTIKSGPAANQVRIFLTPSVNYGPTVIQQMTLVVGWQSSCATTTPTTSWAAGSALTNPFTNSTYTEIEKTGTGSIGGTTYSFVEHTWSRTGGDFATWQGGTEYLLATVTFSGGAPSCPISLLDFIDAGSTGSANVYIADHLGNYFTPQFGNSSFYGVAGTSTTSSGANGAVATTTTAILLPVKLVNFEGHVINDCKVKLNWQTASEENSLRFVIQKSTNGSNWQAIGVVAAAGTSSVNRDYSYTDVNANTGINYYRLLQEDIDGRKDYSSVISVKIDCSTDKIRVLPTVTSNNVEVLLPRGYEKARVFVVNMCGQMPDVQQQNSGLYRKLQMGHLPAGIYMVKVVNADGIGSSVKVVKQ